MISMKAPGFCISFVPFSDQQEAEYVPSYLIRVELKIHCMIWNSKKYSVTELQAYLILSLNCKILTDLIIHLSTESWI